MISADTSEHLQAIRNICSKDKCHQLECGEVKCPRDSLPAPSDRGLLWNNAHTEPKINKNCKIWNLTKTG